MTPILAQAISDAEEAIVEKVRSAFAGRHVFKDVLESGGYLSSCGRRVPFGLFPAVHLDEIAICPECLSAIEQQERLDVLRAGIPIQEEKP